MIDEIRAVIEKKFSRCPKCRSFSVRETGSLTFKEKFQRFFRTVTIYVCDNCSYRFGEFGNISPRLLSLMVWKSLLKKQSFPRHRGNYGNPRRTNQCAGRWPARGAVPLMPSWVGAASPLLKKYSRVVFPILALAVLAAIFLLSPGKEKKPVAPNTGEARATTPAVEKKPTTGVERPIKEINKSAEVEKPQEEVTPAGKTASTPTFAGEIVLGSSNRFGVNWRPLPGGVQITRLSEGPLKKAGLEVGDIITEVNGNSVINQGVNLEKVRDEVFNGKRPEAVIKVLRKKESLVFKIIKNKKR